MVADRFGFGLYTLGGPVMIYESVMSVMSFEFSSVQYSKLITQN